MESEPHTPPQGAPALLQFPTPTVPNNAMEKNYVSDHIGREQNYKILSKEISSKVLGPMPPKKFLDKFLSPTSTEAPVIDLTELETMRDANTEV